MVERDTDRYRSLTRRALMQALMTVVLFPPFGWMFMRIHRAFLQH